jgi:hypothetical protein
MTTEAGRRLLRGLPSQGTGLAALNVEDLSEAIEAIEAEARAEQQGFYSSLVAEAFDNGGRATLTALRERVEGLPFRKGITPSPRHGEPTGEVLDRAAVLAAIDRALEESDDR